ncbi:hypothetical protein C8J56DRAFT_1039574 [Mycena floridula]|nr:hypothetical protein C8J56DRAFT_1039574 [Mycena floridula]
MLPVLLVFLKIFSAVYCTFQRTFSHLGPSIDKSDDWDLTQLPNPNATGNLVFATASSFLQHWPATRYRNGHNVVVGSIAPGTLFYHGVYDGLISARPDWLATDPEHSAIFCRPLAAGQGCWHITFVSTRPLKILYFDGSSGSKMMDGTMDSQDLIIWGKIMPDKWMEERERIRKLCSWGKQFGIDGFVRMEMDSELMHCDLTDPSLEVVSRSKVVTDHPPMPFLNDTLLTTGKFAPRTPAESVYSGSWHNHYPGDTRIRLDYSKLVSFYDTSLFPSLVAARAGQTRIQHRLASISAEDSAAFMVRLETILSDDKTYSSGVDWSTLFRVIQDRFTDRIEILEYLLSNSNDWSDEIRASKAHLQLHIMLQPYILQSAAPNDSSDSWAAPIFELCSTSHTKWIAASARLSVSERLLLNAAEETNREICRVLTNLWADGVNAGLDYIVKPPTGTLKSSNAAHLVDKWYREVKRLMKWLDWSAWLKCKPACNVESICYLPTWPFFKNGIPGIPKEETPHFEDTKEGEEKEDWEDPEPICLRRIEPYDLPGFPDIAYYGIPRE